MYNPDKFQAKQPQWADKIIHDFPFATVITGEEVSHLPLLLEKRAEGLVLIGHMARANPHSKKIEQGKSLAIFHGPHSYITPNWYVDYDVPTWNYITVHAYGPVRLLNNEPDTIGALKKLSDKMEGPDGWKFGIPSDLAAPGILQKAILAFELKIEKIDAKFKLSQNRSHDDQAGVVCGLEKRGDEQSLAVRNWMLEVQQH